MLGSLAMLLHSVTWALLPFILFTSLGIHFSPSFGWSWRSMKNCIQTWSLFQNRPPFFVWVIGYCRFPHLGPRVEAIVDELLTGVIHALDSLLRGITLRPCNEFLFAVAFLPASQLTTNSIFAFFINRPFTLEKSLLDPP
jgi:hypothetical protein